MIIYSQHAREEKCIEFQPDPSDGGGNLGLPISARMLQLRTKLT